MPADEAMMKRMDEAASSAEAELEQNFVKWSAQDLVSWWSRWYLKAGHKRLGRILVAINKKSKQASSGQG